jgi:(S)-citramalyl-CoA lyase
MDELSLARSLLFTPADRPERFAGGVNSGADGAVLDLEDGVGLPNKDKARSAALSFFASNTNTQTGFIWAVRLNHVSTAAGLADLLAFAAASARPRFVMLPKTESVAEVDIAVAHLACAGEAPTIIALLESGRGLTAADEIAAHPAVGALVFGGADLAADLGAVLAWEPMLFARSRVIHAAATAQIPAFDVPFLDIHDAAGLEQETRSVKALGYGGKLAIHPAQIGVVNAVFTPTPDEVAAAARIVSAAEAAGGNAIQLDGKMIDAPVVKAARRTVRLASRSTTADSPGR